jgi:hypothetical protein
VAAFASLTAALVVVVLWRRVVTELLAASLVPVPQSGGLLVDVLVAAFVMVDTTGRLTPVSEAGKLAALVAFSLLLGVGPCGRERIAAEWVRGLASLPAALFVCAVFLAGLVGVDSVTGGLFALAQFVTFGVAAYAYDRSGSLLPPAPAYACLPVANTAVVYGFEAGVRHW